MSIHQKIDSNVKKSQQWWDAYVHIAKFAYPLLYKLLHEGNTLWEDEGEGLRLAVQAMDTIRKNTGYADIDDKTIEENQRGLVWFGTNFQRLWD